ncbi:hypothetical protein HRI_003353000 [Hibiscus trionum]|uniref:Uncharacterized protein n=1 Tax=Hibiscus trionum TaxID=183268 RepID=A0A9W7IHL7_HIBTR|nr:hypothetical protein HRI_003353000 [Hibiscus trionum]
MARDGESTAVKKGVDATADKSKKGSSKDVITSIQGKVTKLEESMVEAKVALELMKTLDMEKLGSLDFELIKSLDGVKDDVQAALNEMDVKFLKHGDSLEATVVALKSEIEELKAKSSESSELKKEVEMLKAELLVLKAAVGNGIATATPKALCDIPQPEKFEGTRSAQDVENFLWGNETILQSRRHRGGC